jgi:hypothetical protein
MNQKAKMKLRRPAGSKSIWDRSFALTLGAALLLGLGFVLFGSAGRDDAHITYWAAYSLSQFGDILNYSFERVEQSSSLFHVLVLSLLNWTTGADLALLGRLSSIAGGLACLPLTYRFAQKLDGRASFWAVVFTASSAFFVYWSFGGLETTIAAATVLWWILASGSYLSSVGDEVSSRYGSIVAIGSVVLSSLALASVRPEMPIVIVCVLLGIATVFAWKHWYHAADLPWRQFVHLCAFAAGACLLLFTFRLTYFGHLLPQPVAAKSGGGVTINQIYDGGWYLGNMAYNVFYSIEISGVTPVGGLSLLFLPAGLWTLGQVFSDPRVRPFLVLSVTLIFAYLSFIIMSGGDWMEGGRFLVPVLPVAFALLAWFLLSAVSQRGAQVALIGVVLLLQIGSLANATVDYSHGVPYWERDTYRSEFLAKHTSLRSFSWFERYNRDHAYTLVQAQKLLAFVRRTAKAREAPLTIASGHMGAIMYHLAKESPGKIQTVDKFGLVDNRLSSCSVYDYIADSVVGMNMNYTKLMEGYQSAVKVCDLPSIDIIYDLGSEETTSLFESGGFNVLYTSRLRGRFFFSAVRDSAVSRD